MTKKSVKPPAFRRSRTTTSSAFLSSATRTALVMAFGNFGWPVGLRAGLLDLTPSLLGLGPSLLGLGPSALGLLLVLRFAMQIVYRCRGIVQMMRVDIPCDRAGHQVVDRLAGGEAASDVTRRDVRCARLDQENARLWLHAYSGASRGHGPYAPA